ncbi:MAG: hypothetical protein IT366_24200 [Candidatus Hydrogenedentes bacterium]|nr:hypothetical protein [Candidatus Hydrogenedentota bacterium]
MFSKIIRSLFFLACTITGGMWASYLVDQYTEHAIQRIAARDSKLAEDEAKRDAARAAIQATEASQTGIETETADVAKGEQPPELEEPPLPRTQSEILKYVDQHIIPQRLVPLIVAFGGLCGLAVAILITFLLRFVTQEAFERFFPALVSVLLAMATGWFLAWYINQTFGVKDQTLQIYIQASLVIICFFIGVNLGLTRTSNWEKMVKAVSRKSYEGRYPKLLDTSVIIDGRIADIAKAGFVEGTLIVPRFVLQELQGIADSTDTLRRARGRRGLDVLKLLQAPDSGVVVEVVEDNPQHVPNVDGKLVAFAKEIGARVITNDQNLLKVAQIEGVSVMNIHDLANALKTIVLPDEQMHVRIVREGKEPQQGVGFLDDGTMVVVDGGREHVGRNVVATVTSVLQTSNGRMIFTRLQSVAA